MISEHGNPPGKAADEDVERPLVLVVDDEAPLLNITRRLLELKGFSTVGCGDGQAALRALDDHTFDAIVSDISMPAMNGIDLLRAVRRRDLDLPVVFITGSPTVETAIQAVELGAFRYLIKPFDGDELVRTTWRATQLYRLAKAKEDAFRSLGAASGLGANPIGLEATFEHAMATLWPAFQPILQLSRRVFAYEALLRTEEPLLPQPETVLDAARRLDRLPQVFSTMCKAATGAFVQSAPADSVLFLNLNPVDILAPELLEPDSTIRRIAPRVVLEITERATLDGVPNVRDRIAALREAGYRIAIDDLGAGYSGLSSFASLEPEFVKLDISLVRDVHESHVKQRLIRVMTNLCHDMGMQVVAEGIENEAELETILNLGCDLLQGHYFGRPEKGF